MLRRRTQCLVRSSDFQPFGSGTAFCAPQLGHSSSHVTRDHCIAKPPVSADLSEVLQTLAQENEPTPGPQSPKSFATR